MPIELINSDQKEETVNKLHGSEVTSETVPAIPDYGKEERDFQIDTDSDSICGAFDPLSCCPSNGQVADGTLVNRMMMAAFAVILLWSTSLSIAGAGLRERCSPTPSDRSLT